FPVKKHADTVPSIHNDKIILKDFKYYPNNISFINPIIQYSMHMLIIWPKKLEARPIDLTSYVIRCSKQLNV
ncbi:MAG TPA: hypothetical protein DCQ58_01060, partial [Saprospirales bacterium]|nr:hypothetical protein [Saprospirales bacterium]